MSASPSGFIPFWRCGNAGCEIQHITPDTAERCLAGRSKRKIRFKSRAERMNCWADVWILKKRGLTHQQIADRLESVASKSMSGQFYSSAKFFTGPNARLASRVEFLELINERQNSVD